MRPPKGSDETAKRQRNGPELHIEAKLNLKGFLKAGIDFLLENAKYDPDNNSNSAGEAAQIGSAGDNAKINVSGADSVICCAGAESMVRAKIGCWVTLSEWEYNEQKERYIPVCVKTEYVDGKRIKEDTWYTLENGEFVETEG